MARHKVYVLIEGYVDSDRLDMFSKKVEALAGLTNIMGQYKFDFGPPQQGVVVGPVKGEDNFPDDYRPNRRVL